jgi:hypothetical protein
MLARTKRNVALGTLQRRECALLMTSASILQKHQIGDCLPDEILMFSFLLWNSETNNKVVPRVTNRCAILNSIKQVYECFCNTKPHSMIVQMQLDGLTVEDRE